MHDICFCNPNIMLIMLTTCPSEKKIKGMWTTYYQGLQVGVIKFKNLSGYFNITPFTVIKDFNQFTSLSYHMIDKKSVKPNWDPFYEHYYIE